MGYSTLELAHLLALIFELIFALIAKADNHIREKCPSCNKLH
jgi:hypothetical protein